jgi:hypothetical protein
MRTTLTDALRTWRAGVAAGPHLPLEELWALAAEGVADAADPRLEHVTRCAACAQDLRELAEAIEEAAGWDVALAKAASAAVTSPVTVHTACGKYTIVLHPRPGADEAIVTVEVAPAFRESVEGATVTVADRAGTVLLAAPIVLGKASARLRGLAALDCTRLVVRTARAG